MQLVILAGGGGTRLWPLSTNEQPKQFINLVNDRSLVENMHHILNQDFSEDNIWVATNIRYQETLSKLLPNLYNQDHILFEPEKRDNFAALVCHSSLVSHYKGDKEPIIFIPCDDHISDEDIPKFNEAQKIISQSLENNEFDIITAGIKPLNPNTNFGYIELGDTISTNKANKVISFTEKPDLEKANEYIEKGNYIWHKCNISFTFETIKKLLGKYYPDLLEIAKKIEKTGEIDPQDYAKFPKISFDYAIMEKVENIGVVSLDIKSWDDIGLWKTVAKYIPETNTDQDKNHHEIQLVGNGNKIINTTKRKIAIVGPSNLMVVDSPEGLLILDPSHSGEIKKISTYFTDN